MEIDISQHVKASTREEVNLGTTNDPRPVNPPTNKVVLITLLQDYRDVLAWSHEDMKGLDPEFSQHQIHVRKDSKLVHQRQY